MRAIQFNNSILVVTLFILCFSSIFYCSAQPQINASIVPTIGDSWETEYLEAPEFDLGASGANIVWDFSNLISEISLEYNITDPNDAPGFDSFPDADFVWELSGFEQHIFYQNESDGITLLGGVNGSPGNINFMTKYIDLEDAFRFPITYQTNYTYYSSFRNYLFGNFLNEADRTGEVTADAYGTLMTPFGTYQDVLRIKIKSISLGDTSTVYSWWDVDEFTPIVQYEESSDPGETPYVVFTKKIISATKSHQKATSEMMTAFINNNQLFIKLENTKSLDLAVIHCFDIQGKLIFTEKWVHTDSHTSPIRLATGIAQLSSGQHFLHLQCEDFTATASFVKH